MSIKDRFIENVLRDEGNRLLRNQGKALRKRLKFHTHRLYDTRRISVSESRLTFTHTVYERFLDMKRLQDGTIQQATYPQPVCLRALPVDRRAVAV